MGVTNFVLKIRYLKVHPYFDKSCSDLPHFLHVTYKLFGKHCTVFFYSQFNCHLENIPP